MPTTYQEIVKYWNSNPCRGGNKQFPFSWFKGKKVLEIGCGVGIDSLRFVEAGAYYTGIDLTQTGVDLTKFRIKNKGIALVMNAEELDFPSDTFDLVYSFGVIHHTLNPLIVMNEIYRVLKPDGMVFIMLYNKLSFRYLIDIMLIRKILWIFNYYRYKPIKAILPHPTKREWISINTDNLGCPMSRVYSKKDVEDLLFKFHITKTWTENWGWFRMTIAKKNV